MKFFQNLPIRRKQMLMLMLISCSTILLTCGAVVTFDLIQWRRGMVENLSGLAEVVGNTCSGALDFGDRKSAERALSALASKPEVVSACIYDINGDVFAVYHRDSSNLTPSPRPGKGQEFSGKELHLFRRIATGNEKLGTIYIASDLSEFSTRLKGYAVVIGIVLLGSVLVAFGLSSRFERFVSEPILQLARTSRRVAQERNYSLRATKQSNDELGELVDGFNEMLAQIQARDIELAQAREQLEQRVEARTRELAQSAAVLNATLEASTDAILALDLSGRVTSYNRQFTKLWNIPPEMVQRANTSELLEFGSRQLKSSESFLERVRQSMADPERESFEEFEFNDGRMVERMTKPQRVDGKCVGIVVSYRDVTERKRAEQTLRRTEEVYRRAIAGAGAVPYAYDFRTRTYMFMGQGIEDLIGYPPAEVNPNLWAGIIKESVMLGETAGLEKADAARRVNSGELRNWRCDMRLVTRDGKSRWISDASVQVADENGKVIGSMGILQDITERKQAEIVTMAFSKLGRDLSKVASHEEAARIISEVADELFGWDACVIRLNVGEEMVHSIFEVDTIDGKRVYLPSVRTSMTQLQKQVIQSGALLILRNRAEFDSGTTPFGSSRPSASLMFAPIRAGHRAVGILSIQSYTPNAYTERDLTTLQTLADHCGGAVERIRADEALRESELQFRLVWNMSVDGMRLTDAEGTVLLVNEAFCRLMEKHREEIEKQPLWNCYSGMDFEQARQEYHERMADGDLRRSREVLLQLWNGRKIWFEVSSSLLELPGQPPLLLSVFRDITPRKNAQAELENVHRQLLDVSRQAGMAEVATNVLHNVGNVLNSVNTSAGVITERFSASSSDGVLRVAELVEQNQTDLATFFSTGERATQIIGYLKALAQRFAEDRAAALEELRELSKNIDHIKEIVAMQQNYACVSGITERIRPADLVEDALRLNSGALTRHQVRVARDYDPATPEITVQKHKLLQVLVNLIRNAKYACDEGGRPDKLITMRVRCDAEAVAISVVDNGVGIPAENLTRIFNHGFTTRANGHGFGLHSGALAAREMGGELIARSDGPGRGAEFTVRLPLNVTEEIL